MQMQLLNEIFKAKLSDEEFKKLSEFIYVEYGIRMPPVKNKINKIELVQQKPKSTKLNNIPKPVRKGAIIDLSEKQEKISDDNYERF